MNVANRRFVFFLIALFLSLLLAGCPPKIIIPPDEIPMPKVGLVLSGGASRGFAHVGVIKALERANIPIDIIVGTSAGSLTGAMYAYYKNAAMLETEAKKIDKEDIFDFNIFTLSVGVVPGKRIVEFVDRIIKVKNIEDLKIPFAAVATDLNTGERVIFNRGSISTAIRASSSIPGVFIPLTYGGRLLVDGGVVDNMPVDIARKMGADIVIAVDITENVSNYEIGNVVDIILQTLNIMSAEITRYKIAEADVVIRPDVRGVGLIDFTKKTYMITRGEEAARRALPQIREAIRKATDRLTEEELERRKNK